MSKKQLTLSSSEVAKILGVNRYEITTLARQGYIPGACKTQGRWTIPISWVRENNIKGDELVGREN